MMVIPRLYIAIAPSSELNRCARACPAYTWLFSLASLLYSCRFQQSINALAAGGTTVLPSVSKGACNLRYDSSRAGTAQPHRPASVRAHHCLPCVFSARTVSTDMPALLLRLLGNRHRLCALYAHVRVGAIGKYSVARMWRTFILLWPSCPSAAASSSAACWPGVGPIRTTSRSPGATCCTGKHRNVALTLLVSLSASACASVLHAVVSQRLALVASLTYGLLMASHSHPVKQSNV